MFCLRSNLVVMARRTQRHFSEIDRQALLDAVGACREAAITACTKAPVFGPEYVAASTLQSALDDMAGFLTGNREHFWAKGH